MATMLTSVWKCLVQILLLSCFLSDVCVRGQVSPNFAKPKSIVSPTSDTPVTDAEEDGTSAAVASPNITDGKSGGKMGGDAWGFGDSEKKGRHCRHGVWDPKKKVCECFAGWSTAHITDTIDFFEGVCEQYHCVDDQTCASVMGIGGASCPVKNWNCYCGWRYAFMMEGHGYEKTRSETDHTGGGECMGIMYTFSLWASLLLEGYFREAWKYFVGVSLLFLFVGRKRFNCDHHRPSLAKALRTVCGCAPTCQGECVDTTGAMETFRDDIAWTLYVLELCMWSYAFFAVVYIVVLFIWSVVLWMIVIITCICLLIAGACAACGEGAGACDCNCCDGQCACGDCCMPVGMHAGGGGSAVDSFYWAGTWPYDPFWGYSGYGGHSSPDDCDCCGGCCITLCRPIAWMIWVFPAMPENMWGGILGSFMGTRMSTTPENLYQGGSPFIDFMGMRWRRTADLHADSEWRRQVHDFLIGEHESQAQPARQPPGPAGTTRYAPADSPFQEVVTTTGNRRMKFMGNTKIIDVDRPFTMEEDACVPSSFDDYRQNQCWICTDKRDDWHMWMSCRHLFCESCSTEMLRRRMPCPLCRVASTTVLRGKKAN